MEGGECWKELWWNCGGSAYYTFSLCYAARVRLCVCVSNPPAIAASPSEKPYSVVK
jgi:hypothetical protein